MTKHMTRRANAGLLTFAMLTGIATTALAAQAEGQLFGDWSKPVSAEIGSHPELNTKSNDGCPILSPDGLELYMATNRPDADGTGMDIDIWVARRPRTSAGWGEPERLPAPVNSDADDFCPTPLQRGVLLFVSKREEANGDIYIVRHDRRKGWGEPRRLGPQINSSDQEWSPSLYYDERRRPVLYFSSTRGGNHDIYKSVNWGPAELVSELNTESDDARPNVRHDGKEIVFDSTRTPNLGGPDVWIATRTSASAPWSEPRHLARVSSDAADTRASLSWDGSYLMVGSTRSGGEGAADIYVAHRERVRR